MLISSCSPHAENPAGHFLQNISRVQTLLSSSHCSLTSDLCCYDSLLTVLSASIHVPFLQSLAILPTEAKATFCKYHSSSIITLQSKVLTMVYRVTQEICPPFFCPSFTAPLHTSYWAVTDHTRHTPALGFSSSCSFHLKCPFPRVLPPFTSLAQVLS